MSGDYWMGVLSVPALVLALAAAWLAVKVVGKIGERVIVGSLMFLGMTAKIERRAATRPDRGPIVADPEHVCERDDPAPVVVSSILFDLEAELIDTATAEDAILRLIRREVARGATDEPSPG